MGRRPIGGIFSVGLEEAYRWKDSVQSEPEIRLWVAEGTANGMRPWVTKFSGVLYDRRWLPVVERIYDWHFAARALPAQRDAAGARRAALLRADGGDHPGVANGDRSRGPRARHVPRAGRGAGPVRAGPRGVPHARAPRSVQAADPRGRRGAVRRAVRGDSRPTSRAAAACSRRSRRRSTTSRASGATDFGLADLFGVSFTGRIDGPMQNSYLSLDADRADRPRGTRCSTGSRTRRASSTACSALRRHADDRLSVAADADPDVSRPADGGRLPARRRTPTRASSTCASSARAASPTFRGTSIARSGRSCASTTAGCCGTLIALGDERAAAGRGRRARR